MTEAQMKVREFMVMAGQDAPGSPMIPDKLIRRLRLDLIQEELDELEFAFIVGDAAKVYDAILDLLYVVLGAGVACGMNLKPGFDEVHRSNMSKFIDGHGRTDGKWVKGPSYSPPNLRPILEAQGWNPEK